MTSVPRIRFWRLRPNPLRRASDRVEGWVVLLTWVLVVVGGSLVGLLTFQATTSEARAERATVRQVTATATADPRTWNLEALYRGDRQEIALVQARWQAPDGTARRGDIPMPEGTKAGATARIWVDAGGSPTTEPPGPAVSVAAGAAAGALAASLFSGAVLCARLLVHVRLERRRAEEWERAWDSEDDPRWGAAPG